MKTPASTSELLQQIGAIQQMEPGKLCVIREGPEGAYYNLQCRENGKTITRYVARNQAEQVKVHTENYRQFQDLVEQYAQQIVERTRSERLSGAKKKIHSKTSSWRKTKKSGS